MGESTATTVFNFQRRENAATKPTCWIVTYLAAKGLFSTGHSKHAVLLQETLAIYFITFQMVNAAKICPTTQRQKPA